MGEGVDGLDEDGVGGGGDLRLEGGDLGVGVARGEEVDGEGRQGACRWW